MYLRYNISRWKRGAAIERMKNQSYISPLFCWEWAEINGSHYQVSEWAGMAAYIPVGMV